MSMFDDVVTEAARDINIIIFAAFCLGMSVGVFAGMVLL